MISFWCLKKIDMAELQVATRSMSTCFLLTENELLLNVAQLTEM